MNDYLNDMIAQMLFDIELAKILIDLDIRL